MSHQKKRIEPLLLSIISKLFFTGLVLRFGSLSLFLQFSQSSAGHDCLSEISSKKFIQFGIN